MKKYFIRHWGNNFDNYYGFKSNLGIWNLSEDLSTVLTACSKNDSMIFYGYKFSLFNGDKFSIVSFEDFWRKSQINKLKQIKTPFSEEIIDLNLAEKRGLKFVFKNIKPKNKSFSLTVLDKNNNFEVHKDINKLPNELEYLLKK